MRGIPVVHIYSQEDQHDDAFIIANREGLLTIQKAISNALEKKKSIAKVYVADGEGYDVKILMNNTEWPSNDWNVLAIPYTRVKGTHEIVSPIVQPWDLWRRLKSDWLKEKPEEIKTDKLWLSYYRSAGKLQIAHYFSKDGQDTRTKVVTLDQEDLALSSQARGLILRVLEEWQA